MEFSDGLVVGRGMGEKALVIPCPFSFNHLFTDHERPF